MDNKALSCSVTSEIIQNTNPLLPSCDDRVERGKPLLTRNFNFLTEFDFYSQGPPPSIAPAYYNILPDTIDDPC